MGEHKGQDIAVEAARALPQTELYLVGPTLPEHREWAAALRARVSANVQVLGEIDDVPGWLARTGIQVMVLPSRRPESLSMAMLESLASSCIVLLSERARMESAGRQLGLRRFADADGLVASLRGMLESPDAAAAESAAQHATLHRVFGPARYAEGIAAAYADARVRAGRERDRRRGQPPR
ncbi:MAG TPA: glycosyltransferase, partial [Gemmatimonadaceae bacterium]|nr:glycosyltransferase [Gemmatimonadaceae bacterium]